MNLLVKQALIRFAGEEYRSGLATLEQAGSRCEIEFSFAGLLAMTLGALGLKQRLDVSIERGWLDREYGGAM